MGRVMVLSGMGGVSRGEKRKEGERGRGLWQRGGETIRNIADEYHHNMN